MQKYAKSVTQASSNRYSDLKYLFTSWKNYLMGFQCELAKERKYTGN